MIHGDFRGGRLFPPKAKAYRVHLFPSSKWVDDFSSGNCNSNGRAIGWEEAFFGCLNVVIVCNYSIILLFVSGSGQTPSLVLTGKRGRI